MRRAGHEEPTWLPLPKPNHETATPPTPLAGFGIAWAIFWALLATVGVQDHLRQGGTELWKPLLWEGSSCVVASAIVWAQWRRAARADRLLAQPWRWFAHSLQWLPLAAPLFVAAVYALRHGVYAFIGQTYAHDPWGTVFRYETLKFALFYLLFVAVFFGIRSHAALNDAQLRLARERGLVQQAQLLQLTQQIEPHFLFNALNTIASTIHTEPDLADTLLTQLAALLRAATELARQPETTLDEELRLLEAYAAIMRQRFAERVELRFDVDPAARACRVPTLRAATAAGKRLPPWRGTALATHPHRGARRARRAPFAPGSARRRRSTRGRAALRRRAGKPAPAPVDALRRPGNAAAAAARFRRRVGAHRVAMRVLIVDDEKPARERLRRLLAVFEGVHIVGEAQDGETALAQVAALAPDALFLDVQMPGASGLDVAASLTEPAPAVVFVTAFDQYALQAFDSAAVDYLLKPVAPDRLARAVQRLLERHRERGTPARAPAHPPPAQLLIPDRGRTHVVTVADILWLEAADNYVVVHTPESAPLMRRTLAGLLADLGAGFVRTHRGAAVALAKVQQVQARGKGDALVALHGGASVPCSRQFRAGLLQALSAHRDRAV